MKFRIFILLLSLILLNIIHNKNKRKSKKNEETKQKIVKVGTTTDQEGNTVVVKVENKLIPPKLQVYSGKKAKKELEKEAENVLKKQMEHLKKEEEIKKLLSNLPKKPIVVKGRMDENTKRMYDSILDMHSKIKKESAEAMAHVKMDFLNQHKEILKDVSSKKTIKQIKKIKRKMRELTEIDGLIETDFVDSNDDDEEQYSSDS